MTPPNRRLSYCFLFILFFGGGVRSHYSFRNNIAFNFSPTTSTNSICIHIYVGMQWCNAFANSPVSVVQIHNFQPLFVAEANWSVTLLLPVLAFLHGITYSSLSGRWFFAVRRCEILASATSGRLAPDGRREAAYPAGQKNPFGGKCQIGNVRPNTFA